MCLSFKLYDSVQPQSNKMTNSSSFSVEQHISSWLSVKTWYVMLLAIFFVVACEKRDNFSNIEQRTFFTLVLINKPRITTQFYQQHVIQVCRFHRGQVVHLDTHGIGANHAHE